MDYPLWHVGSYGLPTVIAVIAVFHVFISHFAIGMGLFVVLGEHVALKKNRPEFSTFIRRSSLLILFISAVIGAITGVGIWFSIAMVSPAGTSALIHTYVWGWASEWVFFILEIVAILVYAYTWGKISDRLHLSFGWLYFIAAWMSLFIINGIITFQLTSGMWPETRSFFDGFFNPTFWPSLVGRTGICLLLAGVYATMVLAFVKDKDIKTYAGRYTGIFVLAGGLLTFLGFAWWASALQPEVKEVLFDGVMFVGPLWDRAIYVTLGLVVFASVFLLGKPAWMNIWVAIIIMILGQTAFGYFEYTRERARKPYVVYDYMYSNGVLVSEVDKLTENGILSKAKWAKALAEERGGGDVEMGRAVYEAGCMICHEVHGFNDLATLMEGLTEEDIVMFTYGFESNPLMPPFIGTDEERAWLAAYLHQAINGESAANQ